MGQEAESAPAILPLEEKDSAAEELNGEKDLNRNQQELLQLSSLQEVQLNEDFAKETTQPRSDIQMQTLQVHYCSQCW